MVARWSAAAVVSLVWSAVGVCAVVLAVVLLMVPHAAVMVVIVAALLMVRHAAVRVIVVAAPRLVGVMWPRIE